MKRKSNKNLKNILKLEKIIIITIALIAIVTIGLGTYAYFNVSKSSDIILTMTYDPDDPPIPDDDFSMRLYEHDENGNEVSSRTYNDIIPGSKVDKDPTIINTGKYDMWVRMNVIFTNASNWIDVSNRNNLNGPIDVLKGISNDWYYKNDRVIDSTNNTITYTFYYKNILSSNQKVVLFNKVEIPTSFNDNDMQKLNNFQIKVTADAIQKDNTSDSCFESFENYWS